MFDIGFWEIALIMVLALVILGPEKLPHAARTIGNFVGKARRYIEGVKTEVEKEFDTGELKRMLHNQEVQIRELQGKLDGSESELNQGYTQVLSDDVPGDDDPGTPHQQQADTSSSYDMFEEGSEGYDELLVTPKESTEEVVEQIESAAESNVSPADKSV